MRKDRPDFGDHYQTRRNRVQLRLAVLLRNIHQIHTLTPFDFM